MFFKISIFFIFYKYFKSILEENIIHLYNCKKQMLNVEKKDKYISFIYKKKIIFIFIC